MRNPDLLLAALVGIVLALAAYELAARHALPGRAGHQPGNNIVCVTP